MELTGAQWDSGLHRYSLPLAPPPPTPPPLLCGG